MNINIFSRFFKKKKHPLFNKFIMALESYDSSLINGIKNLDYIDNFIFEEKNISFLKENINKQTIDKLLLNFPKSQTTDNIELYKITYQNNKVFLALLFDPFEYLIKEVILDILPIDESIFKGVSLENIYD